MSQGLGTTVQNPVLALSGVGKRFGGLNALKDVSFAVPRGSLTSIIGPNGAGKTTLLNVASGLMRATTGKITLMGADITDIRPDRIVRQGLTRTFQNIQLFPNLTAIENTMVGQYCRTRGGVGRSLFLPVGDRRARRVMRERASETLASIGVAQEEFDRFPNQLPYVSQRRVEIARALQTEPQVLMLDEPAAGMIDSEVAQVGELLGKLRTMGITLLLIEHNVNFVMSVSDEVIVMNFGTTLAIGTPDEIVNDGSVRDAYLGGQG